MPFLFLFLSEQPQSTVRATETRKGDPSARTRSVTPSFFFPSLPSCRATVDGHQDTPDRGSVDEEIDAGAGRREGRNDPPFFSFFRLTAYPRSQ